MRLHVFATLLLVACGGVAEHAPVVADDVGVVDTGTSVETGPLDSGAADAIAETTDAASPGLRVLFVGNSYTYTNDLPAVLRRIAATAGAPPTIETAEVLVGGATLQSHWETGEAPKRIDEKTWTHVVLQGQSLEPLFQPAVFQKFAKLFGERATAAGARPTWFVTWARAPGDASFAETWSGATPEGMQDGLTAGYLAAAKVHGTSLVIEVGEAFRLVRGEKPALALHVDDRSHPTLAGTYLAACTFYLGLTGKPVPATSEVPTGLGVADASYLRDASTRVK
ncbi:MAG: hypothetical protein IPJ34_33265 [Myxococcales bacterium]|nr:hypothetical protein [Myxococcales bacterium]